MSSLKRTKRQKLKLLKAARVLLSRRGGWVQGSYKRDHPSLEQPATCLLGAFRLIDPNLYNDEFIEAEILAFDGGRGGLNVADWNDQPSRRKKDVIALIDKRIEALSA